jgi:predicted nucleic acid-binding protein
VKTFLDSGVLLSAWRGGSPRSATAKKVLEDESREFFTSEVVKLEVLPKPVFEKRRAEVEFYNDYFNVAAASESFSAELGDEALWLAKKYGLAAMDALHLASAIRQGADEFITSELPGKPMFRVVGIKVISLHAW